MGRQDGVDAFPSLIADFNPVHDVTEKDMNTLSNRGLYQQNLDTALLISAREKR